MAAQLTTTPFECRQYQLDLVEAGRNAIRRGYKRVLFQLATGAGKTICAVQIIHGAVAKGKRVVFACHRRELVEQTSAKLEALGISHGIVMAKHWRYRPLAPVQVCSIQTLITRELAYRPDILFFDECHHCRSATWQSIIERYSEAIVIGLTATPVRSDGKGLGNLFQTMVCGPSVAELTAQGYLVPTRVFAPNKPNLRDVRKVGGDYNQGQIGRIMDKPTLTGDIVEHWQRLGENRLTVCFAVSVEHSRHLRDRFVDAGIAAGHLDGETPIDERVQLLQALASGAIRVLCSVGVLTEGWDLPGLGCIILARPTLSEGLFLQMSGRGLRPAPDKTDVVILDHAGCTLQHGFVDDDREWSLDVDRMSQRERIDTALKVKACPKCFRVWSKRQRLCECGYVFHFDDRAPRQVAGNLTDQASQRQDRYSRIPEAHKRDLYMRWAREGAERRYRPNFAWAKYHAMFKEPPKEEWMLAASLEAREARLCTLD